MKVSCGRSSRENNAKPGALITGKSNFELEVIWKTVLIEKE